MPGVKAGYFFAINCNLLFDKHAYFIYRIRIEKGKALKQQIRVRKEAMKTIEQLFNEYEAARKAFYSDLVVSGGLMKAAVDSGSALANNVARCALGNAIGIDAFSEEEMFDKAVDKLRSIFSEVKDEELEAELPPQRFGFKKVDGIAIIYNYLIGKFGTPFAIYEVRTLRTPKAVTQEDLKVLYTLGYAGLLN